MVNSLKQIEEFENFVRENIAAVIYFSTPDCSVCKVLKPKLFGFLDENFPKIEKAYVDLGEAKELGGQQRIFTVPTILFYFDGKEFIRKSRNINLVELKDELERIYKLMFD